MTTAPIGVFDSGVGGLTVARAILDQLPHEPLLYVGDTANSPYGPRPIADVRKLALDVMDGLVARGVKMLVIACNAASAACLRDARERYPVPVVEVVLPATRAAVRATRNGRVGVIATKVTIGSGAYDDAFAAAPQVRLTTGACPKFVDFVERGETNSAELMALAEVYLEPFLKAGVDTLVLGCTHYPLLAGVISYVMGDDVVLVSSADETARDVFRQLAVHDLFRDAAPLPEHRFEATGDPEPFARLGRRFLGPEISELPRGVRMKLTVLGCAGTFPGPTSACSSYVIEPEGFRMLIDAGNGAMSPLQKYVGLRNIDAVLVSHLHGDHCLDLVAYSYALRYHPEGPLPRMPVYGPVSTRRRLCGAFDDWPSDGLSDVFDFSGIRTGHRTIGPFEIELDRVRHPIEAYGMRIMAGGSTFTYSGDTGSCEEVERLATDCDLFLCESSWAHSSKNPPGIHMSGRDAGEAAHHAQAHSLLLTHLVPWADKAQLHDEATSQYEGKIEFAEPGQCYDI